MLIRKRFRRPFPFVVIATLVYMLLAQAGLASASNSLPTPIISPDGGTFTTAQSVTIGGIPSGDICYYTPEGNPEDINAQRVIYTGPFTVSQSETIEAANYSPSSAAWGSVATANFVISNSLAITPDGGSFAAPQTVTITGIPSGGFPFYTINGSMDICNYTTDGSNPISSFTARSYTASFTVSQSETVQAAFDDPWAGWSSVVSATFVISGSLPTPVISPDGGAFTTPQSVTIGGVPSGDTCYYTTDWSNPATTSTAASYTGAFTVSQSETVQAAIYDPVAGWSNATAATFTISDFSTPVSSPAASTATPEAITAGAGNGAQMGYWLGDESPANSAGLSEPHGVAMDAAGNLYIADTNHNRIRKVDTKGIITTAAGNGAIGYSGDGGPATSAELAYPYGVAVDAAGNIYISDTMNDVIRKVDTKGTITTVAGKYNRLDYVAFNEGSYSGDNGPATGAGLDTPEAVAVDASGNLYIADTYNFRIRKVDASGIITTVAGDGKGNNYGGNIGGYSGDDGPATSAELSRTAGVAVDAAGNIYISDTGNRRIRKVDASGIITTVAGGGGTVDDTSKREPATSVVIVDPAGLAMDTAGDLYIASDSQSIRKVDTTAGTITTVINSVDLQGYPGVAVDAAGHLYIANSNTNIVSKVDISGIITPVAGNGHDIASGDKSAIFTVGQSSYTLGRQSFATDASPLISDGRALVPVRFLAEALGAHASWDPATKKVTIDRGTVWFTEVDLTIGSSNMGSLSGGGNTAESSKTSQMDVAPVIIKGRTYLPVRYVAEAFGFNVSWNAAAQTITISQKSA